MALAQPMAWTMLLLAGLAMTLFLILVKPMRSC